MSSKISGHDITLLAYRREISVETECFFILQPKGIPR